MLLGRIGYALGGKLLKGTDDTETRVTRLDNIVDITVFRCIVGVAEELVVFSLFFGKHLLGVVGNLCLFGIKHLDCACATHYGDFGSRPCIVHVATELLAAHHDVASAVALAECHRHLGHGSLAIGIEQFRTVEDDTVVFLACAGEEARNVDERPTGC